jgi:quercetin dioxygenase-like cupin family protein
MRSSVVAGAVSVATLVAGALAFAQGAIERKPLQKDDFPAAHATHMMLITVAPGGFVAPHTHPGIEMGYILEGEAVMSVAGQPDRTVKAGDSYLIPSGVVHSAKVTGSGPIRIVGSFVVDKARPLASPAGK